MYDTATESEQQYLAFEYGEQPHNQDKIVKVIAHYSGTGDTAIEDVYQYTYGSDENDPSTYGMLINAATAGEQTYTYVETNADGTDTVSSTTSTKTVEESYTYKDGEANVFTIGMPANTSETGVRTHRFDLDADGRVTKSTDAIGDYSEVAYSMDNAALRVIDPSHQNTVTTIITNYSNGQNIGQGQYVTDLNNHGILVKTVQPGNRVTELGNYDMDVLRPGTITSYKDAAHTQPLTYTLTYNDNGSAQTVTDPEGIRTEYSYEQKPDGTMTDWITSEKTYQGSTLLDRTDYTYDANGNLLSEKTAEKNPTGFTDADTKTTTYTYDSRGAAPDPNGLEWENDDLCLRQLWTFVDHDGGRIWHYDGNIVHL